MMSKRNKRRFWQSQRAYLKAMLDNKFEDGLFYIGFWDYCMEVYRTQKYLGSILIPEEKRNIWFREVLPF